MTSVEEVVLANTPLISRPNYETLHALVAGALASRIDPISRQPTWIIGRLRHLARAGQEVAFPEREGLPALTDSLKNFSALELVAYLHTDPAVRLVANRLLRKLDLNVTEICNYDCSYCYQRSRDDDWETKAHSASGRESTLEDFFNIASEANALGATRVKITGGEPLTKKGILEFLGRLVNELEFSQVELCTNGSLLARQADRLTTVIGTRADRLHIHTSIDGISAERDNRTLTKASPEHLEMLLELLRDKIPSASASVNTMWNPDLLKGDQLAQLYQFMLDAGVGRWTISFPYFVADFIDACQRGEYDALEYKKIISATKSLVQRHVANGMPFHLSIPLVFKQELFNAGQFVSATGAGDHPCFPCHGSFFIVGPEADIFDCLLTNNSSKKLRAETLLEDAIENARNSSFTRLTVEDTSVACRGCRYLAMCHGQCANDRMNTSIGTAERFGRDKTACSLLAIAETEIWSYLPPEFRKAQMSRVDPSGFFPATYRSPGAIARGEPPLSGDVSLAGEQCFQPPIHNSPARAIFNQTEKIIKILPRSTKERL